MTRSEIRENLLVALDTLRSHKVRSGLTILGIVIGVTSVISVASIIDGLNGYIQERVEQFGSRTYFVSRIPAGPRFGRMPEHIRKRKYFEPTDAERLREITRNVDQVTIFGTRAAFFGNSVDIHHGANVVERIILRGAEPEYADAIPLFAIAQGRFITRFDEEHARPVVVIGFAIAESLFGQAHPIGKMVRMEGRQYEVIGVFEHDPGLFGGPGVDNFAVIPFSLFHKQFPENKEFFLAFTIPKGADSQAVVDEMTDAVRRLRKVKHNDKNDFEITSPDFLTNLWSQLTGALVLLTSIISSVGLLVGGIGVMNIMLISVTERTGEIGVRKAIGARKSDIRVQFLLEAVVLAVIGGVIGIALGAGIALVVRTVMPSIPAVVSPLWVTLGVAISVGVGIFFGYYPANRAANLDPIVCLRYE
ncbi:MAG TPA: ABC transporter permease [Bryobacteraceae bacterium]|nr:ABC transporter permease [Bryobacteraceae bacterium]